MMYQVALSVVLSVCLATSAVSQEQTRLTVNDLRSASIGLLQDGQFDQAIQLSQVLLQRDENDVTALLVASQAVAAQGNTEAAASFARRAFWSSSRRTDSFLAARLTANALAAQGKDTRAQVWLRRARQYAPDEATSAAVARDFQSLRNRNPWSTSLNFAITPSSNINNGTLNQTAQVLGLPFEFTLSADAQPLSGFQISGGFNTRYRLHSSATSALFLDFDAFGRTYALSSEAQDAAPDVKGSDFSDAAAGVGLTYRAILEDGWAPTQAGIRFGQSWYSGERFTSTIDLNLSQPVILGENDRLTFTLSSQLRKNEDGDPDVRTRRLRTSWNHALGNGDNFGASLTLSQAQSDDTSSEYDGFGIGVTYAFGETFQGIALSGALDFDQKDYVSNVHEPLINRVDETLRLRLFARLTEIEYYGFQPVITFDARRTSSNVTFFDDRDSYNFGFDLRSSF